MACLLDQSVNVYRPRHGLESDFHRLVRQHVDEFRAVYPDRYARKYGHWRPVFDKAVRRFLKCGDLQHGFARVRCPHCRHEFFVAFSCKQRCICPSCSQKRTLLFGMHAAEDVCLNVPHRQFVWTLPKRLRIFFRYHRKLLHKQPALAWQSILQTYRALLGDAATPGAILAIQTFGQLIHYHPHIHAQVTDGAFTPAGRFIPLPAYLTLEPFLRIWENNVFRLLLDANRIAPAVVRQIRSWRHSGFNVDRSVRLAAGDRDGIERLAQYMARSPFSLARLVRIGPDGQVIYRAEKDRPQRFGDPRSPELFAGIKRNFQVFQPLDFLAAIFQHIPDTGEHPIRYYGYYSNKARGMRAKKAEKGPPFSEDGEQPATPPAKPAPLDRRRWAMLIKKIYHADPLRCPRCGGTMRIIGVIEACQGDVIRKILQHCGLWHDPPPRAPPRQTRPFQAPRPTHDTDSGVTYEADPDFLEHLHHEACEQPQLPCENGDWLARRPQAEDVPVPAFDVVE